MRKKSKQRKVNKKIVFTYTIYKNQELVFNQNFIDLIKLSKK